MSSSDAFAAIFAALPADLLRPVPLEGRELASLVERELARVKNLGCTATPEQDLCDISLWQRVQDLAFAGQLRAILRTVEGASEAQQEFVGEEVALCINTGWLTGDNLVLLAQRCAELPGLLESVESCALTSRHLRLIVELLYEVDLTLEQRRAIVLVLLARYSGETPGEVRRLVRKLITRIDATAAKRRKQEMDKRRQVSTAPIADGQGTLGAVGPMEKIAQIRSALDAAMVAQRFAADDTRTHDEREFDTLVDLICGHVERGHWQVQVIVPYSTAAGGELELADIPGFGAVLPSTARDLTDLAGAMTQIAVEHETGEVLGVSDSLTVTPIRPEQEQAAKPACKPAVKPAVDAASDSVDSAEPLPGSWDMDPAVAASLARLLTKPIHTDPSVLGYRASRRLERILEARDRTCVFPGCHIPAERTDKDHRIPWPRGKTSVADMQCLCRRHHRAKQASFEVRLNPHGDYEWTTRSGWVFARAPQGY